MSLSLQRQTRCNAINHHEQPSAAVEDEPEVEAVDADALPTDAEPRLGHVRVSSRVGHGASPGPAGMLRRRDASRPPTPTPLRPRRDRQI